MSTIEPVLRAAGVASQEELGGLLERYAYTLLCEHVAEGRPVSREMKSLLEKKDWVIEGAVFEDPPPTKKPWWYRLVTPR